MKNKRRHDLVTKQKVFGLEKSWSCRQEHHNSTHDLVTSMPHYHSDFTCNYYFVLCYLFYQKGKTTVSCKNIQKQNKKNDGIIFCTCSLFFYTWNSLTKVMKQSKFNLITATKNVVKRIKKGFIDMLTTISILRTQLTK